MFYGLRFLGLRIRVEEDGWDKKTYTTKLLASKQLRVET